MLLYDAWGVHKSWVARGKNTQAAVGVAVHSTHKLYDIKKMIFSRWTIPLRSRALIFTVIGTIPNFLWYYLYNTNNRVGMGGGGGCESKICWILTSNFSEPIFPSMFCSGSNLKHGFQEQYVNTKITQNRVAVIVGIIFVTKLKKHWIKSWHFT
jgi:hypothetical protein